MKKIQFANSLFGPYQSVEVLDDRYRCDGADLPFAVVGQGVVSDAVEGDFPEPPMSQEELDRLGAEARTERNRLLAECDWVIVMSLEAGRAIPADWATYRQALRDMPQQAGFPVTIDWPVKP